MIGNDFTQSGTMNQKSRWIKTKKITKYQTNSQKLQFFLFSMDLNSFFSKSGFGRLIGCGQFSRVYSATGSQTGRQVFIKILLKRPSAGDETTDFKLWDFSSQPKIKRESSSFRDNFQSLSFESSECLRR
jgi:hypothetical protein